MVFSHRTLFLTCLVIVSLMLGCSGSGGDNPTAPGLPDNEITSEVNHNASSNSYFWEMGEVVLDIEELEATVVPLRTADFTCNIVKFLQPPAGNPANLSFSFNLGGCDFPNALVDLDMTLSHPFPGTDYWGFDTRIIVFGGGSTIGEHDSSVTYPLPTELRLTNSDGYTRWWNRDEFGPFDKIFGYTEGAMAPTFTLAFSKVNGYKYFASGVSATDMPPNPAEVSRGSFESGAVTRQMVLQFPQIPQPFKFKYSVATSWDSPTTSPPSSVSDFPAVANQQEAYQIVVTQDGASTAFFNPDDSTFGGNLILDIEVWDWQAEGDAASEISEIWVESPTLLSTQGDAVEITGSWTANPGSSVNSVIYSGTLLNVTPDAVENQELFITVESAAPTTYEPPLPGFLYPSEPLAAYQLHICAILDTGVPPDKTLTVISPDGGETLVIGETWEITWSWTGAITDVVIEYSTDSGGTYPNVITPTTECDGAFTWTPVPDTPTTTARVRITEAGASPEAQDESDADFTISTEADAGWNPIPGQQSLPATDPEPNQSTATPDLGIQNDDTGNEGAWIVDQEGGIGDGSPYFADYLLDWSGPGGDAYLSGFNYNFAPFGRHDVSSNGIGILGCSANTSQMSPPVVNDPLTCIWYLSYLLDDETAVAGDLYMVTWGDQGEGDPPGDDPDLDPWFHTADVSGGLPDTASDQLAWATTWLMPYSNDPGDPYSFPQDETGDLNIGFWGYPFLTADIYRLPFPEYTTRNEPAPLFEAFDVSDPSLCRLGVDSDSYLTFTGNNLAVMTYMIDSIGNIYGTGYEIEPPSTFWYIGIENSIKIRENSGGTGNEYYLEDATAVDLEMLPSITYLFEGDYDLGDNWLAVLFDTGGSYVVRFYGIDWAADAGEEIEIIDTTDPIAGTPLSLDVDPYNFTVHVLADNGGTIEATVFEYTP